MSSTRSLYRQYSTSNTASSENLPPRTLARVARELRNLHKSPPEGVRLIVDSDDDNDASAAAATNLEQVLCEMQGPTDTPYEDRYFVLKLTFSQDFPAAPPRGFFLTKIYHPNVDMTTGAICVNTLKKDWTSTTSLAHVLAVIRCLLIVPFPESSLNDEAGKLFMESYEDYAKRAKIMACVHGRTYEEENTKKTPANTEKKLVEPEDPSKEEEQDNHTQPSKLQPPLRSTSNVKTTKTASTTTSKKIIKKSSTVTGANNAKLARKKSLKRL
uniref:E2 ubiquitin-conjugating enzyme n=1 Tax=Entomoneis paludosa TaxID=265537 RepID=A0A7S2YQP1_9STRA|mmetsp:Transcript_6071/g.12782  ORF Transcript_6071/g.12782 Transcript_6071/m.12782 type:complete len:271 (+) Transcript_6071:267-1079(+)